MAEEFANEFVDSGSAGPTVRSGRPSIRLFLLGNINDVNQTIAELHLRQFSEVGLWSQPLRFTEIQQQFALNPGEVMRVYKRYLTQ
jgi:hypothetical protein